MADLAVTVDGWSGTANWATTNPQTRAAIRDALPVDGTGTRWGCELYFSIPVDVPQEDGQEVVDVGAIAYWPTGNALCLFWGETPASKDGEPRAASPVAVVAHLDSVDGLERSETGSRIQIEGQ